MRAIRLGTGYGAMASGLVAMFVVFDPLEAFAVVGLVMGVGIIAVESIDR